jgi:hypothetical protein
LEIGSSTSICATGIAPTHFRVTERTVLEALEVGQDVVPAPPRAVGVAPFVVALGLAADEQHAVDGTGSAKDAPVHPFDLAPAEFRLGMVRPDGVAEDELADTDRNLEPKAGRLAAGFDQQDPDVGTGAEPIGDDATGRAGTNDDVVVSLFSLCHGDIFAEPPAMPA